MAGAAIGALDVRPGVRGSPPLCWCDLRGKRRMYALASVGRRRSAGVICVASAALASVGRRRSAGVICVAGAAHGALQGVGCTPWRPWVAAALLV